LKVSLKNRNKDTLFLSISIRKFKYQVAASFGAIDMSAAVGDLKEYDCNRPSPLCMFLQFCTALLTEGDLQADRWLTAKDEQWLNSLIPRMTSMIITWLYAWVSGLGDSAVYRYIHCWSLILLEDDCLGE
jgi:hypothetical protein